MEGFVATKLEQSLKALELARKSRRTPSGSDPRFAFARIFRDAAISSAAVADAITVSSNVVKAGASYIFMLIRSGDLSAPRSVNYAVSGDSENGPNAIPSDFGGAFPTGTVNFSAGQATATVTVTPTTLDAEPA